jgi:hypothetical protein
VTLLQSLWRGRQPTKAVELQPLVVPLATIDGWTLQGTPLGRSVPRREQRELCTLLHNVAIKADTPWTYEHAAEMLERFGERAQAYAVCEAWLHHPAATRADNAHYSRVITRHRDRLRNRLAAG